MLAKGFSVPDLPHPDLPAAISWLPLPAGWRVLGVLLVLALLLFISVRLLRWRRNRWRREAQHSLARQESADGWFELIKRVQLVQFSRAEVSERTPPQLLRDLPLDDALCDLLSQRYCQPDNQLNEAQNTRLRQQVRRWLEALPDV